MLIIESEGHFTLADYPDLLGQPCAGCNRQFTRIDKFESLIDRVRKQQYLIHPNCWEQLQVKLKGEGNGNLPPWAQS